MFLKSKYNWLNIFTFFYLLSSIPALFYFEWNIKIVLFCLFHFVWFGLSSSLYYHRVLTHGSMKLNIVVEYFFLLGGLIGLGGDPIKWAVMHRYHHQHSDFDDDVHSPKHGFFWAYFGWVMKHDLALINSLRSTASDLTDRWHLRYWNRPWLEASLNTIYSLLFLYFGGWNYLFLGLILPIFLSYNFHWMLIASICHLRIFGEQKYDVGDNSRNVWWLSIPTFGESMHNNHHKFPKSINLDSSWLAVDLTGVTARILVKCGLAREARFNKYEDTKK